MKKIINFIISISLLLTLVGCGSSNAEPKEFTENEVANISVSDGDYSFTVKSVTILPKTEQREEVLQVTYEYNNISLKKPLNIPAEYLKVVDSDNNILECMSEGWEGDWEDSQDTSQGEKCEVKHTFKLKNNDINSVYITFKKLEKINCKFKVNVR